MKIDIIKRAEWIVAVLLSLAVLFLLIVRAQHAGALWRDECGALQLARMPTFVDVTKNYQHEAFPLLFPATVRCYTAAFGTSDRCVRAFGLLVGVAMIGVAWFNARTVGKNLPLLFPALIGLSPTFLLWGTSLRGYGLGSVLMLLSLGFTVKAFRQPTAANISAALIAAIASVHCLVNNVPLIAVLVLAALVASLSAGRFKHAFVILALGGVCALSLAPYVAGYLHSDWSLLLKFTVTFFSISEKAMLALGQPRVLIGCFWGAAILLVIGGTTWLFRTVGRKESSREIIIFFLVFGVLSIVIYYGFLKVLSYLTQPWYYLPLFCAVAAAVDLSSGLIRMITWTRLGRLGLAIVALLLLPFAAWKPILERQTNIDVVTQRLKHDAVAEDLIVINPWYYGVSFNWYYRGNAPWLTVPAISEHRIHRYDLVKAKMASEDPLSDLYNAIRRTLASGHRVWIVGGVLPRQDNLPSSLPPAPKRSSGLINQAYVAVWSIQLGEFLLQHVEEGDVVFPPQEGVGKFENVPMLVAQGWRD